MKSHEWKKVVCCGILKFCIRGLLGRRQCKTLFKLCDVLTHLCATSKVIRDYDYEEKTHYTLALIERDFPVSLNIIVFHLLHHLPFYLKRFGPVHGISMYSYERFHLWVSTRVKNRHYPESTVMETYCLYEWANYLQLSGRIPSTFTLHSFDHIDGENNTVDLHLLSDNEVQQFQQYYCLFYPMHNDLCEVYKPEIDIV